ncbi:MAG: 2-oxoacid:acceptor oxidoreductase family protein [Deltaproteobacteria bacterium]|nr:2-oxoacid:acceptor oxidoreductase family protein [Deltaproteobacteria bacterium]
MPPRLPRRRHPDRGRGRGGAVTGAEERQGNARQQILVSGVGGQGVLFVSRLLAEAAIGRSLSVLTSETHGMAQRGGTVVSHLKVGGFHGPLIRTGQADGIIALREENLSAHRRFLAPSGWAVVNSEHPPAEGYVFPVHAVDAAGIAGKAGIPRGTNLVLLGFLLSRVGSSGEGGRLFCARDNLRKALERRFGGDPRALQESLEALALGLRHGME